MTDHHLSRVLFRVVKSGDFKGNIDAVFPDHAGNYDPATCGCYAHIGQHGQGTITYWQTRTRNATAQERQSLKRELERIGYRLSIVSKFPRDARRNRIAEIGGAV